MSTLSVIQMIRKLEEAVHRIQDSVDNNSEIIRNHIFNCIIPTSSDVSDISATSSLSQVPPITPMTSPFPLHIPFLPSHPSSNLATSVDNQGHPPCQSIEQHSPIHLPPLNAKIIALPSEEIPREKLASIPRTLKKYSGMRTEAKIGMLVVKLAREAIFGDKIMKKYMPRGWKDFPALPQEELALLKRTIYKQFPRFWSCPKRFEQKSAVAQEALAQACKHLRHK